MKVYFEKIYEHIGYLFYGIAAERGKLSAIDYARLMKIIDQLWQTSVNGEATLQSHLNGYLHGGIRTAFDTGMDADQAYCFFESYFSLHSLPISKALREKIYETANSIASAFSRNGYQKEIISNIAALLELKPAEVK